MRPDAYKKKRSRQYQANAAAKKGDAPEGKPSNKLDKAAAGRFPPQRVESVLCENNRRERHMRVMRERNPYPGDESDVTSSSDDDTSETEDAHAVLKRYLESSALSSHGTGSQSSAMVGDLEHPPVDSDAAARYMTIDAGRLAQALGGLPLAQTLDLPRTIFTSDELRVQDAAAKDNEAIWRESCPMNNRIQCMATQYGNMSVFEHSKKVPSIRNAPKESAKRQQSSPITAETDPIENEKTDTYQQPRENPRPMPPQLETMDHNKNAPFNYSEAASSSLRSHVAVNQSVKHKQASDVESLETWLDGVVSDTASVRLVQQKSTSTERPLPKEKLETKEEDLEKWLDDILGN